jgi:hypothetical protein
MSVRGHGVRRFVERGGRRVSREVLDPTPALGPEAVALLALGRLLPEYPVLALRAAAGEAGRPVHRLFLHVTACSRCQSEALVGTARLCSRGSRLLTPARGGRPRPAGSPA